MIIVVTYRVSSLSIALLLTYLNGGDSKKGNTRIDFFQTFFNSHFIICFKLTTVQIFRVFI